MPQRGKAPRATEIRRAAWRSRRMAFHTLAEFVATILIMLIGSGSVIGGIFLFFKLRARELEAQDSREADALLGAVDARLRTMETRLGAMERALGAADGGAR